MWVTPPLGTRGPAYSGGESTPAEPKRAGNIKKAHGHGLRGVSRGTSAAELRFCSWKSWPRPSAIPPLSVRPCGTRCSNTQEGQDRCRSAPITDPLFRGFGIPENEQEEEEGGLLVPVQCDTRPSDRVGVWCSLLMARPVSSAAALRAACCTYRPTFSRCFIVNKPYSSNLKLSCNS